MWKRMKNSKQKNIYPRLYLVAKSGNCTLKIGIGNVGKESSERDVRMEKERKDYGDGDRNLKDLRIKKATKLVCAHHKNKKEKK